MTMQCWRLLCAFCLCLTLFGCQGTGARGGFYSSPLLPGDEVEILKVITIEAGLARVYLQRGRLLSYGGIDQYAPFCYFLLRDPLPASQQINPGLLTVESVWLDETTVSREQPVRVASALSLSGGDRSPIAYQFHIKLASQQHGRVTLVCSGAFDMPLTVAPIRLPELREALGDYAQVRVKTGPEGQ